MNIHLVGAELFHADRWTDMTKPKAAFHSFANTPKSHISKGYSFSGQCGKGKRQNLLCWAHCKRQF